MMPGAWTSNRVQIAQHFRHWVATAINTIMELATKEAPMLVKVHQAGVESFHRKRFKLWQEGKGPQPEPINWGHWRDFGKSWRGAQEKAQQVLQPHESFEHLAPDDPLYKIMHKPNEWDTGAELDQELIMYLKSMGNAYEWPVPYKNAPGIAERWIMPAHWVWPMRTGKTNRLIDFYEVRPWGQSASAVPFYFDADEFIRYQYKSPLSKIDGLSPMQAHSEVIDAYEQTALARLFSIQNGANVGDVVQLDASIDANEDSIQRFLTQWKNRYQGIDKFNAPGVLPPGAELVRRAGDVMLAYANDSDQLRDYVLGIFKLSKSVIGFQETVSRANFDAALVQVYYLVINPLLTIIDVIRTERLASKYSKSYRILHRDMTPADRATELQEWNSLTKIAPYKGNEVRLWMGLEPLPEGEEVIVPPAPGADPMAGLSDEDLMAQLKGGGQKDPNEGTQEAAGFGSGFKRWEVNSRWTPSVNGVHHAN
jgi:phage portal protein BeeE